MYYSKKNRRHPKPATNRPHNPQPKPLSNKLVDKSGEIAIERFINKATVQEQVAAYQSQHTFDDFGLDQRLVGNLKAKGYQHPTPIQDQAIKPISQGQDLIGLANTGTGKTAAFLLPIIDTYIRGNRELTLIMVPTRELATQIMDEFTSFRGHLPIQAVVCVGGTSMSKQIAGLRRQPQIVIGTPGRLKDLINQRQLRLERCHTLVLDEVDRMLDMGFIKDIQFILNQTPPQKQSLFFSATMTRDIETFAQTLLKDPITISVRTRETSDHVDQDVIYVNSKEQKLVKLEQLLHQEEFSKVLVFGGTKWGVEKVAKKLHQSGFKAAAIHGNKTQPQRQRALDDFKAERIQILVATDVAARGLDIPSVTHVINFDIPQTYEEYVHRIGRTGRAGQTGKALTFVPHSQEPENPAY